MCTCLSDGGAAWAKVAFTEKRCDLTAVGSFSHTLIATAPHFAGFITFIQKSVLPHIPSVLLVFNAEKRH
jgi:hypothetical protein